MCVCVCLCTCVCMSTYVHVCVCVCVCTCACMYVCVHAYVRACVHAVVHAFLCVCVCLSLCMCVLHLCRWRLMGPPDSHGGSRPPCLNTEATPQLHSTCASSQFSPLTEQRNREEIQSPSLRLEGGSGGATLSEITRKET